MGDGNNNKFTLQVSALSKEPIPPNMKFGVDTDDIDNFVKDILALEIDGKKFRTKYVIPWRSSSPLTESYVWWNLANRERKELTNELTYAKPTAQHWYQLAKEIAAKQYFKYWIDKAFTQALWQFILTLPTIEVNGSTMQAKLNAVLTLVNVNATRMVFNHLLGKLNERRTVVRILTVS